MQALLAIARLTLKAAFRFRLVPLLAVMLIGSVLLLPGIVKHDGTARGLTQIVLTYTLGLTTACLGLSTLWLACGTLARDVEECQMQIVAVKPVARWQIWVGKWLGIMALNALLLGLTAGIVFLLIFWKAHELPAAQREVLRNEVLVARGSFREPIPTARMDAEVERVLQERLKNPAVAQMNRADARKAILDQVRAQHQVVRPGFYRRWRIDLSSVRSSIKDQPLFLRAKFYAAQKSTSGTYLGVWEAGPPDSPTRWRDFKSQAADTFHEFSIPPNLTDNQGLLIVDFANQNETALLFPLDEGLEVLYREGGFGLNYFRGVGIVYCWLGLLAAIGLAAASFLSFPVATFFALGVLTIAFSTGTIRTVLEQGTIRDVNHNTGVVEKANAFDHATVAVFRSLLFVINLARDFSPIDLLSTGRSVTWGQLGRAVGQIVLLLGGFFTAVGITTFTRRELATAQAKT